MPVQNNDGFLKALQYTFFIVVLLYFGKPLFVPLSVALLISFILFPFCRWLEKYGLPRWSSILVGLGLFSLILLGIVALLFYQFVQFLHEWPALSLKLNGLLKEIDTLLSASAFSIFLDQDAGLIGSLISYITEYILPLIPQTLYQSSISLVMLVLILVYVALILYNRSTLVDFLYQIFPKSSAKYIKTILTEVIVTYYNFIKGMLIVYLIVGILNSIGLALIDIPNPIFFGFIASILTFIPYVGITIGALLPMAVSWLKYDSIWYPLGVLLVFSVVQILEAYIIFPLAVSQRLKINALVTMIVIIAGGILWGPLGMILFIPFTAILKLIADQVDEMKPLAILLESKSTAKEKTPKKDSA